MITLDLGHPCQKELEMEKSELNRKLVEMLVTMDVGDDIDTPIGKLVKTSASDYKIVVDTKHIHSMIERLVG